MNAMRESWTDERLDDLNGRVSELSGRVDRGFERIHDDLQAHGSEFVAVRTEMKAGFGGIHRLMIQIGGVLVATLIGVVATLVGVIAT